jgi:L-alanine-DL-glutamate epimerase-like enolase superfamily enzyme
MLRIDSNHAYSLATARRLVRPLEDLGVRNWEDPVGTIEEMRERVVVGAHVRRPPEARSDADVRNSAAGDR